MVKNALAYEGVVIEMIDSDADAGSGGADGWYNTSWANTTDSSKRLNVIVNQVSGTTFTPRCRMSQTITWVNVTTGIHPSQIVDMEGTAMISYDITSIADQLGSTGIHFMMTHNPPTTGMNATVSVTADGRHRRYRQRDLLRIIR